MSEIFENKPKNLQQFCRVCFEEKSNLVSSFTTKVFIENYSCTISEILKLFNNEVIYFFTSVFIAYFKNIFSFLPYKISCDNISI